MKFSCVKAALACVTSLGLSLWACVAWSAQEIRIGAAHFPPYVVHPEQNVDNGLLAQLAAALNGAQDDYHFVLIPTSLPRRYQDFEQGRVDMALFENPDWGWQGIAHEAVDLGLEDAEVFVTLKGDHEQDYFDDLNGKRLALFSGYHYAFAGFDANPQYLLRRFSATLTYSHDSNLMMVLRQRADIALVTRSYLHDFLARNPELAEKLLVSRRIDQHYHHYALVRPGAPINGHAFQALLQRLRADGQLSALFSPYEVAVLPSEEQQMMARTKPTAH